MNDSPAARGDATRILVVEDDALVARDMAETLRELGYQVSGVSGSGEEALRAARRDRPDLALMDIRMPGDLDGVDTGHVLLNQLDLPVIFVTAYGDEDTLARAKEMRPYGYVLKPFDPRELRSTIEIALERRALEERIRASEARFVATLRSIGDAVVATDTAGAVRFLNPSAERLLGLTSADAVGRSAEEVARFQDGPNGKTASHPIQRALAQGRTVTLTEGSVLVRPDGRTIPVSDSAAPIMTSRGGLEGAVLVLRDDSDLRAKEQALRESEERFRQIAERIGHVFWISSPEDGRIEYLSPAYEKVWGRPREEIMENAGTWVEHVHPGDRERVRAALPSQATEGYDEEYRIVRPDGEVRWLWDRAFPVYDDQGRVVRVIGMAEDITDRVAMERRIAQSQKMEAVGQLAGGVAHDFNNLLTVIHSQAELLLEDLDPSSSLRDDVSLIRSSAEQAAILTRKLLAFSRDQMLRPQVVALSEVVAELGRLLDRILGEGVTVAFDLAEDLPQVKIDTSQLEQVIMNLAVNAQDAMPAGGTLTFRTYLEDLSFDEVVDLPGLTAGRHVTLQVSDTGVGMDERTRARIFEPFFTTKSAGEGTGLGMAMVYGVVKQSGGAIHVDSAPGEGAEFFLRFPPVPDPEERRERRETPAPAVERSAATARLLMVEDDASVRRVTLRILRRAGFHVEATEDAESALEALEGGLEIDLMVADMGLPGMNGPELIALVRADRPDLPVIAMSGYAQGSLEGTDELPEDVAYLPKPFTPGELVALVRAGLDGGSA